MPAPKSNFTGTVPRLHAPVSVRPAVDIVVVPLTVDDVAELIHPLKV